MFVRTLDYPYKIIMIKGTSGNANGLLEYICEADPSVAITAETGWRIRKLIYDGSKFNTQVLWANGTTKFDKKQTSYASYTYSA